jgi:RNA polymerase sigma factor (sigma-70 family)
MSDQENFDRFLLWLDPDREEAGRKYETIQRKLIKFFTCRGCMEVEDLADITITRIINKIQEIAGSYVGDPKLYFYGVARKVRLERCKSDRFKNQIDSLPAPPEEDNLEKEQRHDCLERCLSKLTAEESQRVLDYYTGDKTEKIERRKEMAEELGINPNTLRIRVHRLRAKLQKCLQECLKAE